LYRCTAVAQASSSVTRGSAGVAERGGGVSQWTAVGARLRDTTTGVDAPDDQEGERYGHRDRTTTSVGEVSAGTAVRVELAELRDAVGLTLGTSEWMTLGQSRIDTFADVIDDHQWIHVDTERAAESVYGGTIAHGYLTLAASGARLADILEVEGASTIVNYGLDRTRFVSPVRSGSRVRCSGVVVDVQEVAGGFQLTARITTEIEGEDRPACVADVLVRYLK
jgi:acyl dehydratase